MKNTLDESIINAIVNKGYGDPFSVLGMHKGDDGKIFIRTFQPQAKQVDVIENGNYIAIMTRIHENGLYQFEFDRTDFFNYIFKITLFNGQSYEMYDPYRFSPVLGDLDLYLLGEGNHLQVYEKLGAHLINHDGVDGVSFAVWAPNATKVSVVGDFNNWDGRRNAMRPRGASGVWEIFIPGLKENDLYKYEIAGPAGNLLPLKADPYAFYAEVRPATSSKVYDINKYNWNDKAWTSTRVVANSMTSPISIYEVHLGSWKRRVEDGFRQLTYREFADELVPYVKDMGFTHIELLPITEHPFDGSWGYQTLGMFAPTSRFGSPDDFKYMIDTFHKNGISVLMDWVPGHFPKDEYGLREFDGTELYAHADPRQGEHLDWGTKIYNFGRNEVSNFLYSSAVFWTEKYHIDGLRVDAVASMLYLDYSRKEGEWIPNYYGGRENLEAIAFLRRMNHLIYGQHSGLATFAEESTAWPMVSRPAEMGGLGFGYKWNMGWMHDTLEYISKDPIYRKYHQDKLTFGLIYAFNENFVLPLSHDEVVHGKKSMIEKMPGDNWQKFANLRAYYTFMYAHPGKKLLFMGNEFAQWWEWNCEDSLQWDLLKRDEHKGIQNLVRDLNAFYKNNKALYEIDFEPAGFEWIDYMDADNSIISFMRKAKDSNDYIIAVCNFTPNPHKGYKVGVHEKTVYTEVFNSDDEKYGGSGMRNRGDIVAVEDGWNAKEHSVLVDLPPLGVIYLKPKR